MKFITEENLRDLFKKEPFTTYETKAGQRLTPGGRQFLLDQGINIVDDKIWTKKLITNDTKKLQTKEIETEKNLKKKMFYARVNSVEALFLITAEELLSKDVILAQNVINLKKQFSTIKNDLNIDKTETFYYEECRKIKLENVYDDLDDCFEITEFHIQLEKGREIIILHRLRCALREIEPFTLDLFKKDENEKDFCKGVIEKVNQSINTLSQMICSIVGGKICQRKN